MKKLNLFLMLLTVCTILTSCNSLKDLLDRDPVNDKYTENPIAKFEKSKHRISLGRSDTLYKNYNNRLREPIMKFQKRDIKRTDDEYNPTEYILINIDVLEDYLKFLREVEKKNGGNDKKITGVAVFLGAHNRDARIENKKGHFNNKATQEAKNTSNNNPNMPSSDEDIRGRTTIFLAPTYRISEKEDKDIKSEVQRHIPFYIQPNSESEPYKGTYINLMTKFEPNNAKSSGRSNSNTTTETSLNSNEFTDMPPKKPVKTQ